MLFYYKNSKYNKRIILKGHINKQANSKLNIE
jgi:hypothetical protein